MKRMIKSAAGLNIIKGFTLDDVLNLIQVIDEIDIQDSTGSLFEGTADEFNQAAAEDDDMYNLISRRVDTIRAYESTIIILLDD